MENNDFSCFWYKKTYDKGDTKKKAMQYNNFLFVEKIYCKKLSKNDTKKIIIKISAFFSFQKTIDQR